MAAMMSSSANLNGTRCGSVVQPQTLMCPRKETPNGLTEQPPTPLPRARRGGSWPGLLGGCACTAAWLWLALAAHTASAQEIPADVQKILSKASSGQSLTARDRQRLQQWTAGNTQPGQPQPPKEDSPEPLAPLVPEDPPAKEDPGKATGGTLTFDWVMGGPPKSVRLGQRVELAFILRYQPAEDVPLAPLAAGTMDATATRGIAKPNHWPLTGLMKEPREHGGGLEYTGTKAGTEHLTMNYTHAGDKGSTVAAFEVVPGDYEVSFELERDGKMAQARPGGKNDAGYHTTRHAAPHRAVPIRRGLLARSEERSRRLS